MRLLGRIASGTDSLGELLVLPSFVCFEPSVHSAQRRVCTVKMVSFLNVYSMENFQTYCPTCSLSSEPRSQDFEQSDL